MKAIKTISIAGSLLWLIIVCHSAWAGSQASAQLYSLSLSELEAIVADWLTRSGFGIERQMLKSGDVQLDIMRPAEKWRIFLKPHSNLITEIQADSVSDNPRRGTTIDRMKHDIANYIRAPAGQKDISNQMIPPTVLGQIGNVVCLQAKNKGKSSQHSGFIVDTEGLVLSTIHDVDTFHDIKVTLYDGRQITGDIIKKDFKRDLALIDIGSSGENAISLKKGRNIVGMGERVYSIGCPVNLVGSVFAGVINGPPRRVNQLSYWQVNMEIHPGSRSNKLFRPYPECCAPFSKIWRSRHSTRCR